MMLNIYFIYFFTNIVLFVHGREGIYTIIAPGTIRSDFTYNVIVSLHETDGPCEVQIEISSSLYKYKTTRNFTIQAMSTKNVEFELSDLIEDKYELIVKGISGIIFENSTKLEFAEYKPMVFIQTDKATYKPGDLVRFRVLFLDENTQPMEYDKPISIFINDAAKNRIETIKNVELTQGVYTGKLKLSEHTVLGVWNIEVHFSYHDETKMFEVAKYELPKFEVLLNTAKNVALTDEVIGVTVSAKYIFGKPVKGTAIILIEDHMGELLAKRTIQIDGKGHAEFSIQKDLQIEYGTMDLPTKLQVTVEVEENLTSRNQSAGTEITLHETNIIIEAVNPPKTYEPEKLMTYTVAVRKLDGSPIHDSINPVILRLDDTEFYRKLNENGIATFTFKLPRTENLKVSCQYLQKMEIFGTIAPRMEIPEYAVQLNLNSSESQVGEDLFIDVILAEPTNSIVYVVTARGKIPIAERMDVPEQKKLYTIKIRPTFQMTPQFTLFVYYIYENNLRFEEKTVGVKKEFQNSLQLSSTAQAGPGDDIEFHISTQPNSYVGLLGIDQSVLLLKSGNDLNENDIFKSLSEYDTKTSWINGVHPYPGKVSGLVTLTNANHPYSNPQDIRLYAHGVDDGTIIGFSGEVDYSEEDTKEDSTIPFAVEEDSTTPSTAIETEAEPKPKLKPKPRKQFQETWFFEDFENTKQSNFTLFKKIPDTLTSWVITGFSINPRTGFALTKNPTKIQVFKPFFITINVPFSVKQGEVLSIPVYIFNYMNETLDAEVTLDNSDQEYYFTEAYSDNVNNKMYKITDTKRVTVPSNDRTAVSYLITTKAPGVITIKVSAVTALAGDSVHQSLKVEPEGVKQYQNRAFFVTLNDKRVQKETVTIDVPDNAVPDSEHVQIAAIGDIVGLTIRNIENLLRIPIGYGEQNMINFVPSIIVLKYLQIINQTLPNVSKKALNILKIGYQRQLSFRRKDGSFSAYGNSDVSGSTWLTAYVVRYFQEAAEFNPIDRKLIENSLNFLASKQTANGNFAEFGYVFDFPRLNDKALTAFVVLTFLENKDHSAIFFKTNIQKGIHYLINDIDNTEDLQSLSITALVLQKAKHPLADEVLSRVQGFAKNENGFTWWTAGTKRQKRQTIYGSSSDIEITSYILLAMLEKDSSTEVLPIIKWLIMQRNSKGGFTSTQDTVVGLEALIKFAEKTGLQHTGSVTIGYVCEGIGVRNRGALTIAPENAMTLTVHELPKKTRQVKLTAKGNSSSLVQLSYNYNTINKEAEPSFLLNVTIRQNTPPRNLIIDICTRFVPSGLSDENEQKTNMVVMEVALPTGYTTNSETLENLRDMETVLFTETKGADTKAIVYLHSLKAGAEKCIFVEAARVYEVGNQKSAPIVIYDYYDKNLRATEYYEVKTSLCEICTDKDCVGGCRNDK